MARSWYRRRLARKMTAKVLKQLIDKTGIPFITTQMGKGVVIEAPPLPGQRRTVVGRLRCRAVEASADLIVNIGHDVIEATVLHGPWRLRVITSTSLRRSGAVILPQVEVIGDIANAVWQISEALTETTHWDFTRLMAIREANETQIAEGADDNRFPVYPQRLVADIRRVLPSGGIVALDSGILNLVRPPSGTVNTVMLDNWRPWAPAFHQP